MASPKYNLFYSKNCKHSMNFINEAQKIDKVSSMVNMVEIEANRDILPAWLQSVPSLETDKGIYTGSKLFDWLKDQAKPDDMDAAPGLTGKGGFDSNPYSSLTNESVHSAFSTIGQENGCSGVDESSAKAAQNSMDLDKLQASRQADIRDLM